MRMNPVPPSPPEGLAGAARRVGDRWTLLVIESLLDGPRRFGELSDQLDGIAPNILTKRLRHLEHHALVVARPYSRRPLRVSYELTAAGRDLAGAIALLAAWGAQVDGGDAPHRHRACGGSVEPRLWCPTCNEVVDDSDVESVRAGAAADDDVTWV
jgi:DNA-binding HxlR family transcriptional regulator